MAKNIRADGPAVEFPESEEYPNGHAEWWLGGVRVNPPENENDLHNWKSEGF